MKNNRRQFLKNTSLTAFSALLIPGISSAKLLMGSGKDKANCNPTTLDFYGQGPFYTPNAPEMVNNRLSEDNEPGTKLTISGRVHNLDCTEFITDTVIDVWHADDNGDYDNTGFKLRGKTKSNSQGFYLFETIYPGKYLNGSSFRPSHIHFKITPPGFSELTTQLYFEGDPDNTTDPASSQNSGTFDATDRIISLDTDAQGNLSGTWDIVVNGNGSPVGIDELRSSFGMIYVLHRILLLIKSKSIMAYFRTVE